MKFARGHLFKCRGMKDVVDIVHCVCNRGRVADVAKVELEFWRLVFLSHVVLLLLVAAEDADF